MRKTLVIAILLIFCGATYASFEIIAPKNKITKQVNDLYSCPMDCEDGKIYENPGVCPKCQMDLEKKPINSNYQNENPLNYQCPMDCDDGKIYLIDGKCTTCQMNLEKVNKKSSWGGTYNNNSGILKIFGPTSDGKITFLLLHSNLNCNWEIEGIANLTNNNVANYSVSKGDCHINFTFNEGSIQISEYKCEKYHNYNCKSFDGWYYTYE